MPLGDSNTRGKGSDTAGYRDDLSTLLVGNGFDVDFVGSESHGPGSFEDKEHEGHGGWTIDDITNGRTGQSAKGKASEWLTLYQPDMILLMIGTNDILKNKSEETAPARLANLIDNHIFAVLPDVTLLVASIGPLSTNSEDAQEVIDYNASIPGIVNERLAQGKDIYFVDVFDNITTDDLLPDDIHPTAEGYAKVSSAWFEGVKKATSGRITFSQDKFSVQEGNSFARINITRTRGESNASVTLNLNNGTASSSDYDDADIILNFDKGELSKTINVPIIDDALVESVETINLSLSSPTNGSSIGGLDAATLFIADNDVPVRGAPSSNKDSLLGSRRNDRLVGGIGSDILRGKKGNDLLIGGGGDDEIYGGKGNDRLKGNGGNDFLDGGVGNDKIWGGRGRDSIQLSRGRGFDKIIKFENRDKLMLSRGLRFRNLEIEQQGRNTLISDGRDLLAQLVNVRADTINKNDFR
ncbi:MAG: GDSL-type esterase/lipase family protein [Cyanobacteria bacterium P01_A01_bin.37]